MNWIQLTFVSFLLLPQLSFAAPIFKNYPVTLYTGKHQAIKIDRSNQIYKTFLTELKNEKINFAGKYVLSAIGCGGGCSNMAFYNAQNGHVGYLEQSFADCYSEKHGFQMNDYEFHINSQLLIAVGRRSEHIEQCEKVYYLMKNDRLVEVAHYPVWK